MLRSAAQKAFHFGHMSAEAVSRLLFWSGLALVALTAAALGRSVYINVQVMHQVSESMAVSGSSMPLAILCGAAFFGAGGGMWRALCEVIYRLMVRLWREPDSGRGPNIGRGGD